MKNHTSLIISRYTQNTGKLLDQVIVIRKTPDPLRMTVSYPFSYSFSISYSFFFPLSSFSEIKTHPSVSSVSCRTGSLKKGRIHPAAVAANELCHGQLLGNNLVIPSRTRSRSRFLTLASFFFLSESIALRRKSMIFPR